MKTLSLLLIIIISLAPLQGCTQTVTVSYQHNLNRAVIDYDNKKVILEDLVVAPTMQQVSIEQGKIFLIGYSKGDSCPSEYLAIGQRNNGSFINFDNLGNCNEITLIKKMNDGVVVEFEEFAEANRPAKTYLLKL